MASSSSSPSGAAAPSSPPSPPKKAADEDLSQMLRRWAFAAVSAVVAESATFPIDFTKTRLQLQNELGKSATGAAPAEKLGMTRMFARIYATEGLPAMYTGLGAAALRQAVYGGLGIGLYAPVRKLVIGDIDPKDAPLWCVWRVCWAGAHRRPPPSERASPCFLTHWLPAQKGAPRRPHASWEGQGLDY
jgi:hypothetical protein